MAFGLRVLRSTHIPLTRTLPDGSTRQLLCFTVRVPQVAQVPGCPLTMETVVLVHPERWDAFWMAINQPDVFAHPEVRALLVPDGAPGWVECGRG